MAGRRVGYLQLTMMLAGFCLVLLFMGWFFICAARLMTDVLSSPEEFWQQCLRLKWAGLWGGALCGVAWLWSLGSSIAILRSK